MDAGATEGPFIADSATLHLEIYRYLPLFISFRSEPRGFWSPNARGLGIIFVMTPALLPLELHAIADAHLAFVFGESRSQAYAMVIAAIASLPHETVERDGHKYTWVRFSRSPRDLELAFFVLSKAKNWATLSIFHRGSQEEDPYRVLSVLGCFKGSLRSVNRRAFCERPLNVNARLSVDTEITVGYVGRLSMLDVPVANISARVEPPKRAMLPCRLSAETYRRDTERYDEIREEFLEHSIARRCNLCPNFKIEHFRI